MLLNNYQTVNIEEGWHLRPNVHHATCVPVSLAYNFHPNPTNFTNPNPNLIRTFGQKFTS